MVAQNQKSHRCTAATPLGKFGSGMYHEALIFCELLGGRSSAMELVAGGCVRGGDVGGGSAAAEMMWSTIATLLPPTNLPMLR